MFRHWMFLTASVKFTAVLYRMAMHVLNQIAGEPLRSP